MKTKKLFSIVTLLFLLGLQITPFGAIETAIAEAEEAAAVAAEAESYYIDTFIISAYYSPLEGQEHYATGSYSGDIRLNGNGTNGADGTEVYPGMIAAPSKYAFGTKMEIPGIGTVAVHDRGGAIVVAGERGHEHDRLDIWMGYGDAGLIRALNWGKRTIDVKVYGVAPEVAEEVYLEGYSAAEAFVRSTILSPLEFPNDIYAGSEGEEVEKMQRYLQEWGYYEGEVSGFYGEDTIEAIYQFQLDFGIVTDESDLGAGHFGINTRTKFDKLINSEDDVAEMVKVKKGQNLMAKYPDLYDEKNLFGYALQLGDSGAAVSVLQDELYKMGYLRIESTGYFGEVTEHALFKFQQSQGLVASINEPGAGYLGPATRAALNSIIGDRYEMKSFMAYAREEVEQGRHIVSFPEETVAVLEED